VCNKSQRIKSKMQNHCISCHCQTPEVIEA
jgi:hypothetical protein